VGHATADQFYEIVAPSGQKYHPPSGRCWTISELTFSKLVADDRIWFGKHRSSRPRMKLFLAETKGTMAWTWWTNQEVGHNQEATKEVKDIFGEGALFETPKPTRLIQRIVQLATNPNDLVLDSFAGSGTTGHAVLKEGGNRRFILVEMQPNIATPITAERLKRVIQGYGNTIGLGGGFQYCTLGTTLFNADGHIRAEVSFEQLARFVYFQATGIALPQRSESITPWLGVHNDTAVYLIYNGILKDKSVGGGNALTRQLLASLPPHNGRKLIYGTRCLLGSERLSREGVTFRHIPTDLRVE
jgi:adenine-specific DNA-methyltransferase